MRDSGQVMPYLRLAVLSLGTFLTLAVSICSAEIPGYPDKIEEYDAREVAMLPRYCIHTLTFRERVPGGNNPEEIERWYSVMGKTFHAMHHYCWGLMRTNRAILLARTRKDRQFYLESSIDEFDYVILRAPLDFILLPEILTKKGENLIRLGRAPAGIVELQRAIQLRPDYWPPYAVMSDYHRETGEIARAREWLEKGLSVAPNTKALQNRLAELDAVKDAHKSPPQSGTPRQPLKP